VLSDSIEVSCLSASVRVCRACPSSGALAAVAGATTFAGLARASAALAGCLRVSSCRACCLQGPCVSSPCVHHAHVCGAANVRITQVYHACARGTALVVTPSPGGDTQCLPSLA